MDLEALFATPVGTRLLRLRRGETATQPPTELILWKPGLDPKALFRASHFQCTTRMLRRVAIIVAIIPIISLIVALYFSSRADYFTGGIFFILTLFSFVAFLWFASHIQDRETADKEDCDNWLPSVRNKHYYSSRDRNEQVRPLIEALRKIQKSSAQGPGVISADMLSSLHEQVWVLVTSGCTTTADVAMLSSVVAEVEDKQREDTLRQLDEVRRRGEDAREMLRYQGEALIEQVRAFDEFMRNRDR
ncbi:hypothetical protein GCM10023321_26170 [Pseudonocardia eucalypti]|uniref:Transmembrane protein n=1 Tax=Pseudonocardia eucalypti TaxID=648755 RepID=A0ABP9Q5M8_9PSEU|nr:hypothetical protein [Pseudonocardia eucalypti]